MAADPVYFSELSKNSLTCNFDCDLESITDFLRNDALSYQDQRMANTYLFSNKDGKILAFFSISNYCLNDLGVANGYTNTAWNRIHRTINLPNIKRIRNYPAIKIGKLGVHKDLHGSGLAYKLMDFIKGWADTNQKPACRLLLLDAVNQPKQLTYYIRNGFKFFLDSDHNKQTRVMYYDLLKL